MRELQWRTLVLFASLCSVLGLRAAIAGESPTVVDCTSNRLRVSMPREIAAALDLRTSPPAWLELEESGVETEIVDAPAGTIKISLPPRYERYFIPAESSRTLHVRRSQKSGTRADIVVSLHCNPDLSASERISWYRDAAAVSARLRPTPKDLPAEKILTETDRLGETAPDAGAHALAMHLRAQLFFLSDRTSESATAFAEAETAWLAATDHSRALAARVGQVEDLFRSGDYRRAVTLATVPFAVGATDRYFANRLAASSCLALHYLGAHEKALPCYERAFQIMELENEKPELASIALGLAEELRYADNEARAKSFVLQAWELAEGPGAAIVRGRSDLAMAALLLDKGDIADSLSHLDSALGEFENAHAGRWEANAMLAAGSLYSRFGALDDAYALIQSGLERLSVKDAPARVAAGMIMLARTDIRAGKFADALQSAQTAEQLYVRLDMPEELDITRSIIARLQLYLGEIDAAEAAVQGSAHRAANSAQWDLLGVRLAIRRSQMTRGRRLIEHLRSTRLSFAEDVELAELESTWWDRAGKTARGRIVLRDSAERIRRSAAATDNPLLAELLLQAIAPLRALAVEQLLRLSTAADGHDERAAAEDAWYWIQLTALPPSRSGFRDSGSGTKAFDAAVARELLSQAGDSIGGARTSTARSLLEALSTSARVARGAPASKASPSLRAFQNRLPDGGAFLAYIDANARGAMLWITREDAWLVPAPRVQVLQEQVGELIRLISNPENTVNAIGASADTLSNQLLATAPFRSEPRSLLVDPGPVLGAIPWSALAWPASKTPLVERTSISLVRPDFSCCRGATGMPPQVHILTAAQQSGNSERLPRLPTALIEAGLIASALGPAAPRIVIDSTPSRDAVYSALQASGDWVHIAAHGKAQPNRVGYTGIWLEASAAGSLPPFISGIDILDHGVRSDLVVLDACQLVDRPYDGIRPALSFADAVLHAGAHHVIAALWPTSDSAAAHWVPAFYRQAYRSGPEDIAGALREAQLLLRGTRTFRHPFFWASLVHLQNLEASDAIPEQQAPLAAKGQGHCLDESTRD